jgi:ABC-type antimicrobial peptide transport system permease subunit
MSPIIGIILGIVLGGGASYFVIQALFKSKVKDANDKADITLKEAELPQNARSTKLKIRLKK